MAGVGRRSGYRKGVADQLDEASAALSSGILTSSQTIAVVEVHRGRAFSVRYPNGMEGLVRMPARFQNLVFIKRGDALLIESASDLPASLLVNANATDNEADKSLSNDLVNSDSLEIKCVLRKDDIAQLMSAGYWPSQFTDMCPLAKAQAKSAATAANNGGYNMDDLMPGYNSDEYEDEEEDLPELSAEAVHEEQLAAEAQTEDVPNELLNDLKL